jgi:ribosomal protein S18 acetylase RimI-like enzyme
MNPLHYPALAQVLTAALPKGLKLSMTQIPHRFPDMFEEEPDPMYRVSVKKGTKEVAWGEFGYHPGEGEYVAFSVEVDPKFRRQGLGTAMYDYRAELDAKD